MTANHRDVKNESADNSAQLLIIGGATSAKICNIFTINVQLPNVTKNLVNKEPLRPNVTLAKLWVERLLKDSADIHKNWIEKNVKTIDKIEPKINQNTPSFDAL